MKNEKEHICCNDFRDNRGNLICTGHVHGIDSGMECIQAGSHHGSNRRSGSADHGLRMEEDGEQSSDQAVRKDHWRNADRHCGGIAFRGWNVPYDGVEPYGNRHHHRNCRDSGSPVPDSLYERTTIKTQRAIGALACGITGTTFMADPTFARE